MLRRIEELMTDPTVTDVLISPGTGVWVDDESGLHSVPGINVSESAARALAEELLARGGRHIDQLTPIADTRLEHGVRVHAVLAPVSRSGTSLAIRIPRTRGWSLADLAGHGMMSPEVSQRLSAAIANRENMLISGATGSGKTTLLAALLAEVPHDQRIVTIEDVAELDVRHPCVVGLEARQANSEGVGGIGLGELVRQALRMRPDRLVVGECRGPELLDFLTALNTGHAGGGITMHANSLVEVPARLRALAEAHALSASALTALATVAIDLVVHVQRTEGRRVVGQMGKLATLAGELTVVPL
jgi:pilus assembly protein CpaF